MEINSKFPNMGTTIFTVMSKMANEYGAINLGQGFPNFEGDDFLFERLDYYIKNGVNQYAPMSGMPGLRKSISKLQKDLYEVVVDEDKEVTVTSGATEAIFCAISSVVNTGDEVIVFDPCYDSYVPNIELNGGVAKRVNLTTAFTIDWELVGKSINDKTKMIILNSPHNPCGTMLSNEDLDQLWGLVKNKNIFILSDEVYQHIIFDEKKHISPFNDPRMRDRTFSISSFGKTYHVTGWKIGYCLASEKLTEEFRKIHQYITFSTLGATQLAISDMMNSNPSYYCELAKFYEKKRDLFRENLKGTDLEVLDCHGSYFQLVDYSKISKENDVEFCHSLVKSKGVAAIPVSVFYQAPPQGQKVIRLCFAKTDELLVKAARKLR